MKSLGFASVAAVQQYLRYAEQIGLDCEGAMAEAGISPTIVAALHGRIRGELFQALIEQLMLQANDPLFGLHSSQQVRSESYDLIGDMSLRCATLGEAIGLTEPFERLVGDMGITTIEHSWGRVMQSWHPAYSLSHVRTQMVDNVLASWTQYARWLIGRQVTAEKILLERQIPHARVSREYEAFYGCRVHFEQSCNAIIYAEQLMTLPLAAKWESSLEMLTSQAQREMKWFDDPEQRLAIRTRNSIRRQLRFGRVEKGLIAKEFNISERTLQRRLNSEGHCYQEMLDQVRQEMAREMLASQKLSLEDIAYNLGFADVRCFRRRFRVLTGLSPKIFRNAITKAE